MYNIGGTWYIDICWRGKRIRKAAGDDIKKAEALLGKIRGEIIKHKDKELFDIEEKKKILFKDMGREYLIRYSKINKRSYERDVRTFRKHLLPFFGDLYLSKVTPMMIEDYKSKRLDEGASVATINRELALMKHIYTKAIEWGYGGENPVKKVKMFKENNQRARYLDEKELDLLQQVCPETIKPIVLIALNTGMRLGEILNLKWEEIDFNRQIITVKSNKQNEQKYIPMNSTVSKIFEWLLLTNFRKDIPYIFYDKKGNPLKVVNVSCLFGKVVKKAGIKNFRFHDLRHTFASYIIMNGGDINTVRQLLGHKSITTTLRYAHLSPDFMKSTVELITSKFRSQKYVKNMSKDRVLQDEGEISRRHELTKSETIRDFGSLCLGSNPSPGEKSHENRRIDKDIDEKKQQKP